MEDRGSFPIRPEWMFTVRSACQTFYCKAATPERWEMEAAFEWLRNAIPPAKSPQEVEALKDRLKICAVEAGTLFHRMYHGVEAMTVCTGSPVESAMRAWSHWGSPEEVFLRWGECYLQAFDVTHPPSAAEKAAAVLRRSFRTPPSLDELAADSGVSRSGLIRDFRKRYGMSRGEYLTRVRLRWFIEAIRQTDASASQAAEDAGYSSYHNLLDALRSRTGLTPGQLRRLTDDQACEVVADRLPLQAEIPAKAGRRSTRSRGFRH